MGTDSSGVAYGTVEDFWDKEIGKNAEHSSRWYKKTKEVWQKSDDSIEGVLQGFSKVDSVDIDASLTFLEKIARINVQWKPEKTVPIKMRRALDCGAGVGRVTKNCLLHKFETVDLVEPISKYIDKAKTYIGSNRVGEFYCSSLQDFQPQHRTYDCIWIQWSILYLTDLDLMSFLKRCSTAITQEGYICVKENVVLDGGFFVDQSDNSIMRTHRHYLELFRKSGLQTVAEMRQPNFPKSLFPVMMYCLRPGICGKDGMRQSVRCM